MYGFGWEETIGFQSVTLPMDLAEMLEYTEHWEFPQPGINPVAEMILRFGKTVMAMSGFSEDGVTMAVVMMFISMTFGGSIPRQTNGPGRADPALRLLLI
jgi:hypothetical protein